jgi:chromosomal replication initiator protein
MKLTPEIIIKTVADYFEVPVMEVLGTCRQGDLIKARHFSMYFIKDLLKLSLQATGNCFTRDHATIISAIMSVNNQVETNKFYACEFREVENLLKNKLEEFTEPEYSEIYLENDCYI